MHKHVHSFLLKQITILIIMINSCQHHLLPFILSSIYRLKSKVKRLLPVNKYHPNSLMNIHL